jgi:hypothetical protein
MEAGGQLTPHPGLDNFGAAPETGRICLPV